MDTDNGDIEQQRGFYRITKRGFRTLVHMGYNYMRNRQRGNKEYWVCSRRPRCLGKAVTVDSLLTQISGGHNHPPEDYQADVNYDVTEPMHLNYDHDHEIDAHHALDEMRLPGSALPEIPMYPEIKQEVVDENDSFCEKQAFFQDIKPLNIEESFGDSNKKIANTPVSSVYTCKQNVYLNRNIDIDQNISSETPKIINQSLTEYGSASQIPVSTDKKMSCSNNEESDKPSEKSLYSPNDQHKNQDRPTVKQKTILQESESNVENSFITLIQDTDENSGDLEMVESDAGQINEKPDDLYLNGHLDNQNNENSPISPLYRYPAQYPMPYPIRMNIANQNSQKPIKLTKRSNSNLSMFNVKKRMPSALQMKFRSNHREQGHPYRRVRGQITNKRFRGLPNTGRYATDDNCSDYIPETFDEQSFFEKLDRYMSRGTYMNRLYQCHCNSQNGQRVSMGCCHFGKCCHLANHLGQV